MYSICFVFFCYNMYLVYHFGCDCAIYFSTTVIPKGFTHILISIPLRDDRYS